MDLSTNAKTRDGSNATGQDSHTNDHNSAVNPTEINDSSFGMDADEDAIWQHIAIARKFQVSLGSTSSNLTSVSDLGDVYSRIISSEFAAQTKVVRNTTCVDARKSEKSKLPCFIAAGRFSSRCKAGWASASGLMILDLDHIENMPELIARLRKDPCVVMMFISPSGDGLKVVIRINLADPDNEKFEQLFDSASLWFTKTYGHKPDKSGRDSCRLCFMCCDHEAYLNPEATPLDLSAWHVPVPVAKPVSEPIPREKPPGDVMRRASLYLATKPGAVQGSNGSGVLYDAASAMAHGFGLPAEDVIAMLMTEYNPRCSPAWSESEIRHKVMDALTKQHNNPRGWLLNAKMEPIKQANHARGDDELPPPADVTVAAERYLGKKLDDSDDNHAAILVEIIGQIQQRGLAVDALGNLRDAKTWGRVSCDPAALAEDLAFNLRRDGTRVDTARVGETFRTIARVDAYKRRHALTSSFLGKPSSQAGLAEVRRWVRAVTGEERPADIAAVLQWIWLVKNRVAGRHGELHLMLVIFGLLQGSGKSQAVLRLCALWAELFDPEISIETITDERNAPHLANCAIGLWDELGGLAKADMEKLKHRMTATTVAYRPMRTNSRIELPALMSFIGSSNRSIGELVKDSTGMRRFYEIRACDSINWNEINTIDYESLWQAISEDEQAPGIVHRGIISAEQTRLVWRDPIQRWMEDEVDAGWQSTSGLDGVLIHAMNPEVGASTHDFYQRLRAWCVSAGEREPTRETMGRRLSELGWEGFRLPRSQGKAPGYRQLMKVPPSTLSTMSTDAPVQGVQGGHPSERLSANGCAP